MTCTGLSNTWAVVTTSFPNTSPLSMTIGSEVGSTSSLDSSLTPEKFSRSNIGRELASITSSVESGTVANSYELPVPQLNSLTCNYSIYLEEIPCVLYKYAWWKDI